ncbi:hypothetical protein D3C79_1121850 [compost metagenome]
MGLDQAVGKLQRVRGGVANAIDAIHRRHHADQLGQVRQAPVVGLATVAVDVLT